LNVLLKEYMGKKDGVAYACPDGFGQACRQAGSLQRVLS